MNRTESFYVYRFRNVVALSVETPDGIVVARPFLTPETARALAAQLVAFAADVDARTFSESTLVGATVPAVAQ
tara:strand:+ start:3738 stop:3956 length:219 start_codon:yes stop_codon:yes gene_type:complete